MNLDPFFKLKIGQRVRYTQPDGQTAIVEIFARSILEEKGKEMKRYYIKGDDGNADVGCDWLEAIQANSANPR